MAVLATHEPVRRIDHFRVGSITNTFVATLVLQLVGEKRVSLTDTIEKRLPGLVPNGDRITIRELLQHTSGLYDYTEDPRTFAPYLAGNLGFAFAPRKLVAIAVSHKPLFPPGARWSYSNTNYVLLGLIVESVTRHHSQGSWRAASCGRSDCERRASKPARTSRRRRLVATTKAST